MPPNYPRPGGRLSGFRALDLATAVGMAPQAISNQLQRLTDRRIVSARREGTRLYYSIADPFVAGFLDLGLCLLEETSEPAGRRRAAPAR